MYLSGGIYIIIIGLYKIIIRTQLRSDILLLTIPTATLPDPLISI